MYRDLVRRLESRPGATLNFPLSEAPCFFARSLMDSVAATGIELIDQILSSPEAMTAAEAAVPDRYRGQAAEVIPTFAQVDFGLVRDAAGNVAPKLVELQAFASLYGDRKSTRLNSSHLVISYAVFCLKKKKRK